jgi:hypothetical protein
MAAKINVSITSEKIASWEKEIKEIESRIASDQTRLGILRRRIENVALYLDEPMQLIDEVKAVVTPLKSTNDLREMTPPSVVEFLVNHAGHTITLAELKKQIEASGYDVSKFGTGFRYLYTLIPRLVEAGRISKVEDRIGPKRTPVLPGMNGGT